MKKTYTALVEKLRTHEDGYGLYDDAADAIEELLAAVPKWISVEERFPAKYDSVITVDKYGNVCWNYLINEKYGTWSNGYHITHWMPLPTPPKEDAECKN